MRVLYALFFILLSFFQVSFAGSSEILVVESHRIQPYAEALRGVKSVCGCSVREIVLSEVNGTDLIREIRKAHPPLIVAVGRDALSAVKEIQDIPIVYTMVLNPRETISGAENITGVSMSIPPVNHLNKLLEVSSRIKRVGLIYNPEKTGERVDEIRFAARYLGISLIAREAGSPKEAFRQIDGMKGLVDALWMVPDVTVVVPETVEYLLLFSVENRIPVLTFSRKYVEMGALLAMNIDRFDMGKQAGEMVKKILAGTGTKEIRRSAARKAVFFINTIVAKKMGIAIGRDITRIARGENGILTFVKNL